MPYVVKKGSFAVVYMSHDRDDRRTFLQVYFRLWGFWLRLRGCRLSLRLRLILSLILILRPSLILILPP